MKDLYEFNISNCAKLLKKYRKEKGISQLGLEILAELNHGTISRIENEKTNPSKETLLKIASVLELKFQELLEFFKGEDNYTKIL